VARLLERDGYLYQAVGAETAPTAPDSPSSPDSIDSRVARILQLVEQEQRARRITLIVAGVGALFAAARLGIVAIPWIKAARRR